MRIIGGSLGGRRFHPPSRIPARPTTDLAREGLFNILANMLDLDGCTALELFGGTGGVSYELVSRGAAQVTLVEQDAISIRFIRATLKELGIEQQVEVIPSDVFRFLKLAHPPYDFIFADPPYALPDLNSLPDLILGGNLLQPGGLFVLEHNLKNSFEAHPAFLRSKKYGDTIFTFFQQNS